MKYLSELKSVNYDNLDTTFREKIKDKYGKNKFISRAHDSLPYLDSSKISQNELINRIIISLFKMDGKDTVDQLSQFISKKYLIREEAKVKLGRGKQNEVKNLYDILPVWEVNQLKDKKLLTFTENNKSVYKIDEKVSLKLKIKNIKIVSVKLFRVNLEKHYLESAREVNEEMNLKFLVALNERL